MDNSSAFTPLSRLFTNERARELEDTRRLYASVKASHDTFPLQAFHLVTRVYRELPPVSDPVLPGLAWAIKEVVEAERYLWELPEPAFDRMNLQEFTAFRGLLHTKQHFYANEGAMLDFLQEALCRLFCGLAEWMPKADEESALSIPLVNALPDPGTLIDKIYGTLIDDTYQSRGMFADIGERLHQNLCKASGREPNRESTKPWRHASDSELAPHELVETYLAGTPFADLMRYPIPLQLTHEDRFNHTHIIGGTGAGKTSLIQNLILHDLRSDDPPSLVVVDPHGDLIRDLLHADLGIDDRLVLIDPRDTQHPPALNVFALNRDRIGRYDDATREQVTAGVIQTFDYLFSGLVGADLTAKQGVFFKYVARLMLSLPETLGRNATILDMIRIMADDTPYRAAIRRLPDIPREFFERDFNSKTFQQTKEQIRYRLQAIIENPTLARLFTSPDTKIDLFTEMNRGAVILVDTAKDFLKGGSSNFGRIFISLVLQAVLERAVVPPHERKATFLIVDEAGSYFDSNIDDLLTEARKYRCGLVLAHQYLDQAASSLRASLAANTGIKFASGLSSSDARQLAPDMRTTPDFIMKQPKLQFAAYIRNVTPQAVSIPVRPGAFANAPKRSRDDVARLLERNRGRVSFPERPAVEPPRGPSAPASPGPAPDLTPEW